jgi:diguanylate cyclase (GGDEF)-like protein/PAS domain S-box-containing protein
MRVLSPAFRARHAASRLGGFGRGKSAAVRAGQRFERGFDDAALGMMMLTPELLVTRANPAICSVLGRAADELVGRSILDFRLPDDLNGEIQPDAIFPKEDDGALVKRFLRPDGSIVEAFVTSALVESKGVDPYIFAQVLDVTAQRRVERQFAAVAGLARRALECSDASALMGEAMQVVREILGTPSCAVARMLANGSVRVVATASEPTDYTIPPDEASQTTYTLQGSEAVVSDDLPTETRFSAPTIVLELGLHRSVCVPVPEPSGATHVIAALRFAHDPPFTSNEVGFMESVARVLAGVLDRAATELELRRRALEDPLTGLANQALLTSQLEAELSHARRLGDRVCVLKLDLDRFKLINQTLGPDVGDALLRKVAVQLTACVREEDLVARPGADEFTVVCTRTAGDHAIGEVAQRLVDAVSKLIEIDGHELFLTASVGVVVSEHGSETPEELLCDAETAMHRAKERGGGRFETFDMALRHRLVERRAIENELRHAVERDQLVLHYQPLIDLIDENVIGFEALLRWRHPERGLVQPDTFIKIAEDTGLIVPIGSWVLREVCAQLARWPEQIRLSANLSALQIKPELVGEVEQQLAGYGVTPGRLMLELTESLVLDPHVKPVVARLRALGVQLALDDFGTGYSSLGSLQRFPMDLVKLDRTLIASLAETSGVAVVRAAIELGQALGVEVIAEGIEGAPQHETLRELGCALGQGFLFAKPLALADAERLLEESGQLPAPARKHAA